MSSSLGDNGAPAVVRRPTWVLGDVLGDVVLCAEEQFIDMGPNDVDVGSEKKKFINIITSEKLHFLK